MYTDSKTRARLISLLSVRFLVSPPMYSDLSLVARFPSGFGMAPSLLYTSSTNSSWFSIPAAHT